MLLRDCDSGGNTAANVFHLPSSSRRQAKAQHIFRGPRPARYSETPAGFFEGDGFPGSFKARGLLGLILAQAASWRINVRWLVSKTGWSEGTVYKYMGELRALGYVHLVQRREAGKYGGTEYLCFRHPNLGRAHLQEHREVAELVIPPISAASQKTGRGKLGRITITNRELENITSPSSRAHAARADEVDEGKVVLSIGYAPRAVDRELRDEWACDPRASMLPRPGEIRALAIAPEDDDHGPPLSPPPPRSSRRGRVAEDSPAVDDATVSECVRLFDEAASMAALSQVVSVGAQRRKALAIRLAEIGGVEAWGRAMVKLGASRWCGGHNPRGWRASFDWVLRDGSLAKLIEGVLDNRVAPLADATSTSAPAKVCAVDVGAEIPDPDSEVLPPLSAEREQALEAVTSGWSEGSVVLPVKLSDREKRSFDDRLRRVFRDRPEADLRGIRDLRISRRWLHAGARPDREIFPIIEEAMKRSGKARIRSWAFFNDDIDAAIVRRRKWIAEYIDDASVPRCDHKGRVYEQSTIDRGPAGTYRSAPERYCVRIWDNIFRSAFDKSGKLVEWRAWNGPPPGDPGCLGPSWLLDRNGIEPTPEIRARWADKYAELLAEDAAEAAKLEAQMAALAAKRAAAPNGGFVSQFACVKLSTLLGRSTVKDEPTLDQVMRGPAIVVDEEELS